MFGGRRRVVVASIAVVALAAASCARLERKLVRPERVETLDGDSPFLKVHMHDGDLFLLTEWRVSADRRHVTGVGERYDPNRDLVANGTFTVDVSEIALFETNVAKRSKLWIWMTVVTGASVAMTAYCLTHTKACFGSCPTFYASDGDGDVLQAEAFSAAVAPGLEERDIDALYRARPTSRRLELRVTNEALETHVIRRANVLAVARPEGGRVFATRDGRFYGATELRAPSACEAAEGTCADAVAAFDGTERRSETDPRDLATRETIELVLEPSDGVVIAARQTFVTTFLFYTLLSYLGSRAGEVLARLDGEVRDSMRAVNELLGVVELQAWTGDRWARVGAFAETGPIATDVQLVVLPDWARSATRFRLDLAKGHWRVDWVAGAALVGELDPTVVPPHRVRGAGGVDPGALSALVDPEQVLTTLPGDEYTLEYRLPPEPRRLELFLDARGYYLEWMRREWLAEENPAAAALMLYTPALALRWLAPRFKELEPKMETVFWGSRYARP